MRHRSGPRESVAGNTPGICGTTTSASVRPSICRTAVPPPPYPDRRRDRRPRRQCRFRRESCRPDGRPSQVRRSTLMLYSRRRQRVVDNLPRFVRRDGGFLRGFIDRRLRGVPLFRDGVDLARVSASTRPMTSSGASFAIDCSRLLICESKCPRSLAWRRGLSQRRRFPFPPPRPRRRPPLLFLVYAASASSIALIFFAACSGEFFPVPWVRLIHNFSPSAPN